MQAGARASGLRAKRRAKQGNALSAPNRNSQPGARTRCGTQLLSFGGDPAAGLRVQLAPSYDTTIVDGLTSANDRP
jgi:hypothetical protein